MPGGRTLVIGGLDAAADEIALERAARIGRPIVMLTHARDPHATVARAPRPMRKRPPIEMVTGHGAVSSRGVAAIARASGAGVIVVGDAPVQRGRITALIDYAPVPVLVARAAEAEPAAVVGTDLRDEAFPAIRAAGALARDADIALTVVHAVEPCPPPQSTARRFVLGAEWQAERVDAAARRLRRALWSTDVIAETVIAESAATLALDEAVEAAAASLVIVGTRRRRIGRRTVAGSTATTLARSARCTVLVLPLPPCR